MSYLDKMIHRSKEGNKDQSGSGEKPADENQPKPTQAPAQSPQPEPVQTPQPTQQNMPTPPKPVPQQSQSFAPPPKPKPVSEPKLPPPKPSAPGTPPKSKSLDDLASALSRQTPEEKQLQDIATPPEHITGIKDVSTPPELPPKKETDSMLPPKSETEPPAQTPQDIGLKLPETKGLPLEPEKPEIQLKPSPVNQPEPGNLPKPEPKLPPQTKPTQEPMLPPKAPKEKPVEPKKTPPKPPVKPPAKPPIKPAVQKPPIKKPAKPPGKGSAPAPPPQLSPEDIPEGLKKEVEESLPAEKKLIDAYGMCKVYELPTNEKIYVMPVPKPHGPERAIINTVKEAATRLITISPDEIKDPTKRRGFFKKRILEILDSSPELGVPPSKMDFYAETIMREMIGYGSLDLFLQDDQLEDIMINGPNRPSYAFHRKYGMLKTNLIFGSDEQIKSIIDRIARDIGRRIDIKDPLLDARLQSGSRVNATIPPISLEGATITVRQFREDPFTFIDLVKLGTMSPEVAAFFWVAVEGLGAKPANILVSGGTASGKTTTLNVMASFIPNTERIITIEDTAEIKLPMDHWIRFETRPPGLEGEGEINMDTLLKNTLRMRPDRVIVGEIRGPEAFTLFTAMNTGHDGSLGTVHANNSKETVVRLKSPPMKVPKTMLSALDFVVVQKRIHDRRKGVIRRISEVAELTGILEGEPKFNYVFTWDPATDSFISSYDNSVYLQELSKFTGLSNTAIREEIKTREGYIKDIVEGGRKPIEKVCADIHKLVG